MEQAAFRVVSVVQVSGIGRLVIIYHFNFKGTFGNPGDALAPEISSLEVEIKNDVFFYKVGPIAYFARASECDFSQILHYGIKKLTFDIDKGIAKCSLGCLCRPIYICK